MVWLVLMYASLGVAALAAAGSIGAALALRGTPPAPPPPMARARSPVWLAVARAAVATVLGILPGLPLLRSGPGAAAAFGTYVVFVLHGAIGFAFSAGLERWAGRDPDRAGSAMRWALVMATLALVVGAFQGVYSWGALEHGPAMGSAALHDLVRRLGQEPLAFAVVVGAQVGSFGLFWGVPCAAVLATRLLRAPRVLPAVCVATLGAAAPGVLVALFSVTAGRWLYERLGGESDEPPAAASG